MAFLQELPEETAFDVLIMDFPDVADSQVLEKLYSASMNLMTCIIINHACIRYKYM